MSTFGITGHRFLAEVDKIEVGIQTALRGIEGAFLLPPLTALSSCAEGADRLVVSQVLQWPNVRLVVPLPLPVIDYMKDFHSAESKEEFRRLLDRADEVIELPHAASRNAAYRNAGLYILDHCDVLIAVWDGKPAQGSGGSAEIVAEARRRKLPIAWVHAGNRKPGTNEPTSLGAEQGMVTFENFPSDAQRRPDVRG